MAKIHSLKISNFRGIKNFEHVFNEKSFICLIGRGDSCKTTILHAISAVLSPSWDYKFYDTDFYDCDVSNPIEIEVSLLDLPSDLLSESKFGLYKRLKKTNGTIIDDLTDETEDCEDVLTIKLTVNEDLEPVWNIVNNREGQDNTEIRSKDRSRLNAFIVSDYIDRHFAWSKGMPLYSLLNRDNEDFEANKILAEANRNAQKKIKDDWTPGVFKTVLNQLKTSAAQLGLSVDDIAAFVDFKNILVKEGSIALHDEKYIPFRLKGKGSKRLLSFAIQIELAKLGGIILIDEVEQGLEPDRVKFFVKHLKDNNKGQVFITTHSNNVIVELDAEDLYLKRKGSAGLIQFDVDFQGVLRNNPNAFFSKKIIVCEGATEVGICRALNDFRIRNKKPNYETLGISIVDGTGSQFVSYCKKFKTAGFEVCAFCDSDEPSINLKKPDLTSGGIELIDCESGNSIEQQLLTDLPWIKVISFVNYAIKLYGEQSVYDQLGIKTIDDLKESAESRTLIGEKAKGKGWFKRIDHGYFLGEVWFDVLNELKDKSLEMQYNKLMNWIDL